MVRHCVLFRFTDATTAADVDRISAAAAELPKAIPAIRSYTFGPDPCLGSSTMPAQPAASPRETGH